MKIGLQLLFKADQILIMPTSIKTVSSFQGRKDKAEHSSQFQNISQDSNEINKPIKFDSTLGSTMHSADDIEKILSSKRANGKLYYNCSVEI